MVVTRHLLGLAVALLTSSAAGQGPGTDPAKPLKLIQADYIELAKIASISKFRSAVGHDFSDGFESCRSMKHYFKPREDVLWSEVRLFSPVAGTIIRTENEFAGMKVDIQAEIYPAATFSIFHVKPAAPLRVGQKVAAGQALGFHFGKQTYSDIAVGIDTPKGRKLVSYFEVLTDPVFENYRARGLASREVMVISRAERDADPLTCLRGTFASRGHSPDWVDLK